MRIYFPFFIIKLIFNIIIANSAISVCPDKNMPILDIQNNSCVLKYCSEDDFSKNICKLDNDIIATQWLNKIIDFGVVNCKYKKCFFFK